jgi:hypothetical protein
MLSFLVPSLPSRLHASYTGLCCNNRLFYLEIPLLCVAAFLTWVACHIPIMTRLHTIDWPGAFVMVVAVTSLSIAMTWGGISYGWDEAPVLVMFALCVVALIIFCIIETRARDPILPPRVLAIWNVGIGFTASFLTSFAMIGTGYYLYVPLPHPKCICLCYFFLFWALMTYLWII